MASVVLHTIVSLQRFFLDHLAAWSVGATASKRAYMHLRKRSIIGAKKDFFKVVGTPSSFQPLRVSAHFSSFLFLKQVQCNMPQNSKIMCRVTFAYTREIFSKGNIKNPMNGI